MHHILKYAMLVMLLASGALSNIRRPTKVVTKCCETVSPARITDTVTGFRRQNALDPCVQAIIFETKRGQVCSSPRAAWVQKKIKEVPELP